MTAIRSWTARIRLVEHDDGTTTAEACLDRADGSQLRGHGSAWCAPWDVGGPAIGPELATGRALSDLSRRVLRAAAEEVEGVTERPVRARR